MPPDGRTTPREPRPSRLRLGPGLAERLLQLRAADLPPHQRADVDVQQARHLAEGESIRHEEGGLLPLARPPLPQRSPADGRHRRYLHHATSSPFHRPVYSTRPRGSNDGRDLRDCWEGRGGGTQAQVPGNHRRKFKFFARATGCEPYEYQSTLASLPLHSRAVRVPTGAGKTAAA